MPQITLPDGSQRQFDHAVTVRQVAESIGPGLAKAALAGKVDERMVDLSYLIHADARLAIITGKDDEALELIRHDAAHVMAQATQELFPGTQVTIGPAIENGFYYDFARDTPFTPDDLAAIEARMREIVGRDLPIERRVLSRAAAVKTFGDLGEAYKVEIIKSIPEGEEISVYHQGEWFDVCRGPHLPSTGKLPPAFKLMKVAGAYWRGDARNEALQRIYGTAWANKKQLEDYLRRLQEAAARDHRVIGKKQDLFHMQEEAPGMVFWHPKGWTIYKVVENYMREQQRARGYREINTPQLVDYSLWEKSGHAEAFGENMFSVQSEGRDFAIKPMNCPCHVQVFKQGLKSYRDLPLRLAEFGACHRNELSGALHGLMRARGFTQDDAHIFCSEAQIQPEVSAFIDFLHEVYRDFGFDEIIYRLATRPPRRVGADALWDKAEQALAGALRAHGLAWRELPGEGAFYGPKVEFSLKDCIGRVWQCGTIQVDFSMPGRLGAEYVDERSARQTPVMLHRAILGSFERFIGILIENHAGSLPLWLSPVQAVVMNITSRQEDYARRALARLTEAGLRAEADLRNEKINLKIRELSMQRVPYLLIVGEREARAGAVAVRARDGGDLGAMPLDACIDKLRAEARARG